MFAAQMQHPLLRGAIRILCQAFWHILSADAGQLSQAEQLVKSTLAEAGNPKQMWTFSSSGWLFVYFFGVNRSHNQCVPLLSISFAA